MRTTPRWETVAARDPARSVRRDVLLAIFRWLLLAMVATLWLLAATAWAGPPATALLWIMSAAAATQSAYYLAGPRRTRVRSKPLRRAALAGAGAAFVFFAAGLFPLAQARTEATSTSIAVVPESEVRRSVAGVAGTAEPDPVTPTPAPTEPPATATPTPADPQSQARAYFALVLQAYAPSDAAHKRMQEAFSQQPLDLTAAAAAARDAEVAHQQAFETLWKKGATGAVPEAVTAGHRELLEALARRRAAAGAAMDFAETGELAKGKASVAGFEEAENLMLHGIGEVAIYARSVGVTDLPDIEPSGEPQLDR